MTKKLYLDEANLAGIGLSQANIATLRKLSEFVALEMEQQATQAQLDIADADLTTLAGVVAVEQANIDAAEDAISDLEDGTTLDGRYVRQDQAAAPAFSAYAGQTVGAAYVQGEAQTTDNATKANATALAALIAALQSANVLT